MYYFLPDGDIFDFYDAGFLVVNPTNCRGPMGAGLAKAFADRIPGLEDEYKELCREGDVKPGDLILVSDGYVLNVATKDHWKNPSQYEWVEQGLHRIETFVTLFGRPKTVAIPALGTGLGGLPSWKVALLAERVFSNSETLAFLLMEPA